MISKRGKRGIIFLIISFIVLDGYFLIGDRDNFYVFRKETIYSYSDVSEKTVEQPVVKDKQVKKNTEKITQKASDKLKGVMASIFLFVLVYLFYKSNVIKRYKANLRSELYEIKHLWLGEKTLEDIIVAVHIIEKEKLKESDICLFFSKIVAEQESGIYYILGQAGEGKTVSIRKVCGIFLNNVSVRGIRLGRRKHKKKNLIPVIFSCIEMRKINSEKELINKIVNLIIDKSGSFKWILKLDKINKKLNKIIRTELKNGGIILFFDGFDEIKEDERQNFFDFIYEIARIYDQSYYVVASRTAIFEDSKYISLEKEHVLWLAELDKERILDFLEKWNFKNQNEKWNLYEKILGNYQLERLAGNPLLLTLICYLTETSKLELPNSISAFYEESIKCLLENWEDEKKIARRIYIDIEIKEYMLEEIAYWQYGNEEVEFKYTDIRSVIKRVNAEYGENAKNVFREIYLYTGLLERVKGNRYKFYHRSFYEYFLAKYLLRNKNLVRLFTEKSGQHYNVLFFYYSLLKNVGQREKYIKEHLDKPYVVEPLFLENVITNTQIVDKYINHKIKNLENTETEFQFLGNMVVKYPQIEEKITKVLYERYQNSLKKPNSQERYKTMQRIISALSYYERDEMILKLILKSRTQIDIYLLAQNANVRLSKVFSKLFHECLDTNEKVQMLKGFIEGNNYNCILQILKDNKKEANRRIIFQELLYATKKPYFIGWIGNQNLSNYINPDIKKKIEKWSDEYGWKWNEYTQEQLMNRYILVYYLTIINNNRIEKNKISSRIKYVATYIKNRESSTDDVKNYYIDLKGYKVKTISELAHHWKVPSVYEKIRMNPNIGRNIEIAVSFIVCFVLCMSIIYFKQEYRYGISALNIMDWNILERHTDKYKYYMRFYTYLQKTKNLNISRYRFRGVQFWIFYFLWFYIQHRTYYWLLEKPYNTIYKGIYSMIGLLYISEYLYLIQNDWFRIGGIILAIVIFVFAMNQHKYNMPSYREPLYSKIVEYLNDDEM